VGLSENGDILYVSALGCQTDYHIHYARKTPSGYVKHELTSYLTSFNARIDSHIALGIDGTTLVLTRLDFGVFLAGHIENDIVTLVDEHDDPFKENVNTFPLSTRGCPTLSGNGLVFTFCGAPLDNPGASPWPTFQSTRSNTSSSFGVPVPLKGEIVDVG